MFLADRRGPTSHVDLDRLGSAPHVDLDHEWLVNMDLDDMDQTVVDDIMSNIMIDTDFTIEEEITLLQEDGLLDLNDHIDIPCNLGIEATDMGSLLEQFEEASQTLGNCDFLVPSLNVKGEPEKEVVKDKNDNVEKKELTDEMIQRLKSATKKQKPSTVMLPMGVPAKRGLGRAMTRGHPVAMPANCTPRRLQRVMAQNQELRDSIPVAEVVENPKTKAKKPVEPVEVDENYFELILDHDYTKNVANPIIDSTVDDRVYDDVEDGEIVEEEETHEMESFKKTSAKKPGRAYRRRGGSPEIDTDSSQYFDKLPSYFTALSIPRKQFKKTAACVTRRGGLSVNDYFERGNSPVRDTSSMYDKLPDYYSSFINSTKYDSPLNVDETSNQDDSKYSSGYSSPCPNSLVIDSQPPSRSDSPAMSQSHSLSRSESRHSVSQSRSRATRRQSVRRSSYSPNSRYSSSRSCSRSSCCGSSCSRSSSCSSSQSCSTCDSRSSSSSSRSRSRTPARAWIRERNHRAERTRRRSRSSSVASSFYDDPDVSRSYSRQRDSKPQRRPRRRDSRSRRRSHYRSPSRQRSHRRYRSRSSSTSRGYRSRSRSRSMDRSSRDRYRKYRSDSQERMQMARQKEREQEKTQQIKERRIVYVGGLPNNYKRHSLRSLFSRFGEIEHIQLHFREHGDNYGFVTFMYTCDAYAAIERGRLVPGLEDFDLCFGGRRQFCDVDYADLDGNKEVEEEYDPKPQKAGAVDFDELLRQARKKLK